MGKRLSRPPRRRLIGSEQERANAAASHDAYVLRERRWSTVAWISLGFISLAALATGPIWVLVATGNAGIDHTSAAALTAIIAGSILLVGVILSGLVLFARDQDSAGVSLILDKQGVYLGGRPARRLAWNAMARVTVFIEPDHEEADLTFWTSGWPAGECCIEFRPRHDPDGGAHGRHHVGRGLRREFADVTAITEVREALLRFAPRRVLGNQHPDPRPTRDRL